MPVMCVGASVSSQTPTAAISSAVARRMFGDWSIRVDRPRDAIGHRRLDRARADDIAADPALGVLERSGLRQADDGVLRRAVRPERRGAVPGEMRADVHDCTAASALELREDVLHVQEDAERVDVHHPLVVLRRAAAGHLEVALDSRDVEHPRERPPLLHRALDVGPNVVLGADVGLAGDDRAACAARRACRLLECTFVDVDGHHVRTLARELADRRGAHPAAGARDDETLRPVAHRLPSFG